MINPLKIHYRNVAENLYNRYITKSMNRRIDFNQQFDQGDLNWDNCLPECNGEFYFLERYAENWKVFLDIGANKGIMSKKVLAINPACKIIAVEPNSSLIPRLKSIKGVKVVHAAAGEKKGTVTINFNCQNNEMSSIYRTNEYTSPQQVKLVTIDDLIKQKSLKFIDCIKIDTEGNEVNVIKGMKHAIKKQQIGMIQFEYGGCYTDAHTKLKQMFDLLNKQYSICHMMPYGLLPMHYDQTIETYRYSNWVAISRKLWL